MIPKLLVIPLLVGFIAQISKFIWHALHGVVHWRALNNYGGMPSAHTAIAVSLVTVIGLADDGVHSPAFALASIFSILVIRDAVGFRQYLGGHSRALNQLVDDLPETERGKFHKFRERLGHTPLEAFVGAVLGFSLSVIFFLLIP